MPKILNSKFYILIAILIIAAFLRLYNITETPPGLYPDEAIYANNGVEAWETGPPAGGLKVFYPENNGREGLWPNIIGFFIVRFGHEPWVPRSIAAIFGILTVLGVYFLARELFRNYELGIRNQGNKILNHNSLFIIHDSEKIALLSSFFLAVSFWHINFSRIGFRAIMAPFFLVWGIYFLLKSLNANRYTLYAIVGGILYGLGFHTYIAYRATPLLILIIFILYRRIIKSVQLTAPLAAVKKKFFSIIILFSISAMVAIAPLGIYFLENPQDFFGRTTQISIFNSPAPVKDLAINILKTAGMFNVVGDFNWRHNYSGRPELFWPVGILFLIGVFLAVKTSIQNSKFKIQNDNLSVQSTAPVEINTEIPTSVPLILIFWLVVAVLPVVISNEGQPHALRAILMAPPVFILAGIGGIWLYEKVSSIKYQVSSVIIHTSLFIILSLLIFEAYTTYFILWGNNQNVQGAFAADYAQIGRELRKLPNELPKYVIVEANGVDVRGIPMPAQTVMFLTDTFTPEKQKEKNLYYILPNQIGQIPQNGYTVIIK